MILAFNHYISDVFVFGAFNSTIIGRQGFPQFEKQMSGSLRLLASCVASRLCQRGLLSSCPAPCALPHYLILPKVLCGRNMHIKKLRTTILF